MPLMGKKILANMAHMQYHLRKYHDAVIQQVGKTKWNANWIIVLTHLALIMPVLSMNVLGNLANMQYHPRITPCYIYLASLVNENEIPMELLC